MLSGQGRGESEGRPPAANPLATESRALHIYGGDLLEREGRSMWNPHTSAREVYDVKQLAKYTDELSDPR